MDSGKKYNFKGQNIKDRNLSPDKNYRNYNNKIKTYLINYENKDKKTLLDLATGKFGDLFKWLKTDYSVIMGIDSSNENIYDENGAYDRLKKIKTDKTIIPIYGNCFKNIRNGSSGETKIEKEKLKKFFKENPRIKFDKITCNFAIHYFKETDETWNGFLYNIKNLLKKDGYFVGTYLDGKLIPQNKIKNFYNNKNQLIYSIKNEDNKLSVKTLLWNKYIEEPKLKNGIDLPEKYFRLIKDDTFFNLQMERNLSNDEIILSKINRFFIYQRK